VIDKISGCADEQEIKGITAPCHRDTAGWVLRTKSDAETVIRAVRKRAQRWIAYEPTIRRDRNGTASVLGSCTTRA
jgi:hypothetical protein